MIRLLDCKLLLVMLCLLFSLPGQASGLIMVRSQQPFPETMSFLQAAIRKHGYTVSRVQRVDVGLSKAGFETDKYRVVFYGRLDEVRDLIRRYPELASTLPLKISIFAEGDNTLLVAIEPDSLPAFMQHADLAVILQRWSHDLHAIMEDVRIAGQD
jgi:uncharacterized protein (DUF302 family)